MTLSLVRGSSNCALRWNHCSLWFYTGFTPHSAWEFAQLDSVGGELFGSNLDQFLLHSKNLCSTSFCSALSFLLLDFSLSIALFHNKFRFLPFSILLDLIQGEECMQHWKNPNSILAFSDFSALLYWSFHPIFSSASNTHRAWHTWPQIITTSLLCWTTRKQNTT